MYDHSATGSGAVDAEGSDCTRPEDHEGETVEFQVTEDGFEDEEGEEDEQKKKKKSMMKRALRSVKKQMSRKLSKEPDAVSVSDASVSNEIFAIDHHTNVRNVTAVPSAAEPMVFDAPPNFASQVERN